MKIIKLFLVISLVSFTYFLNDSFQIIKNTATTVKAYPWEPCEPDCKDDLFETGGIHTFTFNLGGCDYEIDFYFRHACDYWCDFNIYRITLLDSMCINSYSVSFLLDYAMVQLITHSKDPGFPVNVPCSYPENPNECNTFWRVNNAGCFSRETPTPSYDPTTGEVPSYFRWQTIFPCLGTTCCFRVFKACRDQYSNLVITPYSVSSSGTCPQTDPTGGTCYSTCD